MKLYSNKIIIQIIFCLILIIPGNLFAFSFFENDVIDVSAKKFGRLKVELDLKTKKSIGRNKKTQLFKMVKDNLLWSGIFDVSKNSSETDLWIYFEYDQKKMIRAMIVGEDAELVFQSTVRITKKQPLKKAVLILLDNIIFNLTNERSLFKSAILYVEKLANNDYQIVLIDSFGKNKKVILKGPTIKILPRFRPDARAFIYTEISELGSRLVEYDLFTKKEKTILKGKDVFSGGSWFFENKELIITISTKGNSDLYWINDEGAILKRITKRTSIESNPDLSIDGERLLFVSNRGGSAQIYQMNLRTEEIFRMTFRGNYNVDPKWSPDGEMVVFSGIIDGKYQLFIMDKFGEWTKQLTSDTFSSEQPVWSPDGKQILYTVSTGYEHKLFVMRADGSFRRELTKPIKGVNEFNPVWISDFEWARLLRK